MVSPVSCIAFFLASAVSVLGQIDLTPTASTRELEGIKFPELLFKDGNRKIAYDPPAGWTYSGNSKSLALRSADKTAEASIMVAPLEQAATSSEGRVKEFRQTALR